MSRAPAALALVTALSGGAAGAVDLASGGPVELLEAAAETCLTEVWNLSSAVEVFRAAGWEVAELDGGAFGISGPGSVLAFVNADGYCRVEAEGVGLQEAQGIARKLANTLYPEQFKEAEDGPCTGYTITTFGGLVALSFDGLGQDPVCPDPNGTSIVIEAG